MKQRGYTDLFLVVCDLSGYVRGGVVEGNAEKNRKLLIQWLPVISEEVRAGLIEIRLREDGSNMCRG